MTTAPCSMGVASAPASFPSGDTVWVEDAPPPPPASVYYTWTWTTVQKTSGTKSLTQPSQNQYFTNAPASWTVSSTDKLVLYVLTDKCNPPREIMLEFSYGADWAHRAFWGENLINEGVLGTESRYRVGDLPAAGVWTRLEVPAAAVGMGGQRVYGLSFRNMYGQTWFDRFGKAPQSSGQNLIQPGISSEEVPVRTAEVSPATQPENQGATLVNARGPRFGRIRGWVSRNVAQRVRRVLRRRPNEPAQQPPVSMAMTAQFVATAGPTSRRYSFYSPELNLIAESEYTDGASPAIPHEYIWFGGQPVAQIEVATSTTNWTFADHLGTPILQTDATSAVTWRGEYEPYGQLHQLRTGVDRHQPLRFPGQEAEQMDEGINGYTERSYNIFRWYRAGWGRYSQGDPLGLHMDAHVYRYSLGNPIRYMDLLGLGHRPGGPLHQPDNVVIKCDKDDPCPVLREKIAWFSAILADHIVWAATHPDDPHSEEITGFTKGLANCFGIYWKRKDCHKKDPDCKEELGWWEKPAPPWLERLARASQRSLREPPTLFPGLPAPVIGGVPVPVLVP